MNIEDRLKEWKVPDLSEERLEDIVRESKRRFLQRGRQRKRIHHAAWAFSIMLVMGFAGATFYFRAGSDPFREATNALKDDIKRRKQKTIVVDATVYDRAHEGGLFYEKDN